MYGQVQDPLVHAAAAALAQSTNAEPVVGEFPVIPIELSHDDGLEREKDREK